MMDGANALQEKIRSQQKEVRKRRIHRLKMRSHSSLNTDLRLLLKKHQNLWFKLQQLLIQSQSTDRNRKLRLLQTSKKLSQLRKLFNNRHQLRQRLKRSHKSLSVKPEQSLRVMLWKSQSNLSRRLRYLKRRRLRRGAVS